MSLLNRTVDLHVDTVTGADDRGNDTVTTTTTAGVRCRREWTGVDESNVDEARQTRRALYFFAPGITLDGLSRIVDEDGTYQVDGPPDPVDGRAGLHHFEVRAYLIEGA